MQLKYLGITIILVLLLNVLSVFSQNDEVTNTGNANSNELEGNGLTESKGTSSNNVSNNEETPKTTASTNSSSSGSNRSYRRNTSSTRTITTTVSKVTQTPSHSSSSHKANPVQSGSIKPNNNVESNNSIPVVSPVNTDTTTVSNDNLNSNTINGETINNSQNDIPVNNNEFVEFLDKIKFKFIKPEEYTTIYSNTYLNVQWESEYIDENEIRNIGVYLQGLVCI